MGDIVNLKRERKRRARLQAESEAVANRAKHGVTKGERKVKRLEEVRRERVLDGHRIERDD